MLDIIALRYISLSEINKFRPEINKEWIEQHPAEFKEILFSLGVDVEIPWDYQENLNHRNAFNESVTCDRIVGNERTDQEWVDSGFASREAIDKSKQSRLLTDLYRMKGLVQSKGESVLEV